MEKRLLVLDDDRAILNTLKDFFADKDLELTLERDCRVALERIKDDPPQVALIDITLPGKSGLEVLREIKGINPHVCVIMMTNSLLTQNAIESMIHGAYDYLTKPLDFNRLETVVNKAFQSSMLTREIRFFDGAPTVNDSSGADIMIGSAPEMIEIWKMVGKIANSDATALIQGESGTGKELLARSIYSNSRRKNRPFMAINCAALPENLLESELFGHEKGAFTDAVRKHIGRFEQCNGGTIFLDEIAETSQQNQAKLLRVLENQDFERVGGNETIKVDVRIIAATNRSLITAVKEKRFRLDLFYRLRVISFFLPPLRERIEDIPVLVHHFVKKYAAECRKPMRGISPAAMKLLCAYQWEGNIRELKNVINSAVVFSRGDTLLPEDFDSLLNTQSTFAVGALPPRTHGPESLLESLFESVAAGKEGTVYGQFISMAEKTLIRMTMEKFNDNQVHAAKFLGIARNTLRQRLASYGE
jgi:two-component system nitrogen regulation response regulator GlnG